MFTIIGVRACVRVNEDDVGVSLKRLGEEGAGDAAADDDDAVAAAPQHGSPCTDSSLVHQDRCLRT
jgi:hypothetical protein